MYGRQFLDKLNKNYLKKPVICFIWKYITEQYFDHINDLSARYFTMIISPSTGPMSMKTGKVK